MAGLALPFHKESIVRITASPQAVFQLLDDHQRLAAHMETSSWMMAGASMKIDTDSLKGQALGSVITLRGNVLGMALSVSEEVTDYAPPHRKTWETLGAPRLLVIGAYRMGFELEPVGADSQLRVWIDYDLPSGRWAYWLGRLLGDFYASWCVQRMGSDAAQAFCEGKQHGNA